MDGCNIRVCTQTLWNGRWETATGCQTYWRLDYPYTGEIYDALAPIHVNCAVAGNDDDDARTHFRVVDGDLNTLGGPYVGGRRDVCS